MGILSDLYDKTRMTRSSKESKESKENEKKNTEKEPSKEAEQVQNKDVSRQSHDTITTTPQDNGTSNNESMSPSATKSSGTQRGISQIGAIQQQILNSGKKPQAKEHATKEIMNTENSSTKEQK